MARASRNIVSIISSNGSLQLRFTHQGSRRYLSLGLRDTPSNRKLAEAKAKMIEADIVYERLDASLDRYRNRSKSKTATKPTPVNESDVLGGWLKYVEHRKPFVSPNTVRNQYASVTSHLRKAATNDFQAIKKWLLNNVPHEAARRTLQQLRACSRWAAKEGIWKESLMVVDDWLDVPKIQTDTEDINPFNDREKKAILEEFSSTKYKHLVQFLFLTGCRTGEAWGLKWQHIPPNMEYIFVSESLSNGFTTDTKTHKSRKIPCNIQLKKLLESVASMKVEKTGNYVFNLGSVRNFQKVWTEIVNRLVAEEKVDFYRSSYNTRHTFITNCLEKGIPVPRIARWAGNTPEVIFKHYAGVIKEFELPEL